MKEGSAMYENELKFMQNTIKKTYLSLINVPLEVMNKGDFDTVTNIDYAVEKALIEAINAAYPHDTIISEEFNPNGKVDGRTWVIDPIDGTVNFSRNSNVFGIQVAFFAEDEVQVSYFYFPRVDDELYAQKGHGAYYNGVRLEITKRPLEQMIMSFSDFFIYDQASNDYVEKVFLGVKNHIFRTRIQGSAAYDFSLVARSVNDALLIRTSNLWDLAPGYLLMKECGATIVNEKLDSYHFSDFALIAFNNPELVKLLQKI